MLQECLQFSGSINILASPNTPESKKLCQMSDYFGLRGTLFPLFPWWNDKTRVDQEYL